MKSVVFIGSGNVASNLAPAIDALDNYAVVQVYSRNIDHAERLCEKLQQAKPIAKLKDIDNQADFVIIAVGDDVVVSIADSLPRELTAI
ncbi:MAG: NAD(P)-binding domain-containing protein, partial [Muribaculaceae bacterium]|nr:NAD(P)-binding domain-containing protein [Muribaculaceae bacterium]